MKKLIFTPAIVLLLAACHSSDSVNDPEDISFLQNLEFPQTIKRSVTASLRVEETGTISNAEAVIPAQCYTKHDGQFNPCMTCHQTYEFGSRPNQMQDGDLQSEYAFSDIGVSNHWQNLFEDRTQKVAAISDQHVIDYIYSDNYTPLIAQLKSTPDWIGPVPEIENLHLSAAAFDELGMALDGSHWVAFNYKPLPSTFWPTNGSTDDVMVRLTEQFRTSTCNTNSFSGDTYLANLSIMEAAIKDLDTISVPAIDENEFCSDLNGDGQLGIIESIIVPDFYVGNASNVAVYKMLYPLGTEFLHTVRYVGVTQQGDIMVPPHMKEVRYMQKYKFHTPTELASKYNNERQEKIDGLVPSYTHRGDKGSDNGFGWMVQGFIEAEGGSLRLQSSEEHLFCMGCHTTIGTTVDQTFAFPRKVTGAKGWGYINLKGMQDAPYVNGAEEGEVVHYLKTAGGGNEFRENDEIIGRFFNADGSLNEQALAQAEDVYELITPTARRALQLNKAYMSIVQDQDFIQGRDATITPVTNVYADIINNTPVLDADKLVKWDIRLDWGE